MGFLVKGHLHANLFWVFRSQVIILLSPPSLPSPSLSPPSSLLPPIGDQLAQLQKLLRDFTRDLSQVQSQLEAVQREKSVLQSKALEMERMHVQMKEHMGSDINYLRQLNLQLVEQQMKGGEGGRREGGRCGMIYGWD